MKIYLTDQKKNLTGHLNFLKSRPVMKFDKSRLTEKTTTINIDTKTSIDYLDLSFLFNYEIFPGNIMSYLTEWESENRKMKVGDTIVQQVYLPPVKSFSQKVVFGVRINEVIEQPDKRGFSYETLEGHVERGISSFTVVSTDDGLIFKIQTFSEAGNLLTKLLGPIFSIPYQAFCTKRALKNVKMQVERQ
jgi:hypothetical protein